ncbi:MAG: autotransporter domain-containing protein [Hyphomicrobiales bacterium]|nr:autotransporter domain-containing protein [Hyphomicrobiales bacterium]
MKNLLLTTTALTALTAIVPAKADFLVPNGITVTTTQTLGDADTGTIEAGGTIATTAADAVRAEDENVITNSGSISAVEPGAAGVSDIAGINVGNSNTITNSGAIFAGNNTNAASGIRAEDGSTIFNTGAIDVVADNQGNGVRVQGGSLLNVVVNSGTLSVLAGNQGNGIFQIDNGPGTFINEGVIDVTAGNQANGIFISSGVSVIENSGSIRVKGDNQSNGLFVSDIVSDASIENTGSIEVIAGASGGSGVRAVGVNSVSVLNTGSILIDSFAGNAFAINFGGTALTELTLLEGTLIAGRIELGGTNDTVNLGRGENWLISFTPAGGAPTTLNTFGAPTAILNGGLTVATFDGATTALALQDDAIADLTQAINTSVYDRLNSMSQPAAKSGSVKDAEESALFSRQFWAQGFGGKSSTEDGDTQFAGFIAGFDAALSSNARGGFFAGLSQSDNEGDGDGVRRDNGITDIDTESAFAGLYGRYNLGASFVDLTVTAGRNDNETGKRRILNNLSPTGLDFAAAEFDGTFFNPELRFGNHLHMSGFALIPSVSVGYVGLSLDSVKEKGSAAAVSFDERDIELVTAQAQLDAQRTWLTTGGAEWTTSLRLGARGFSNIGDDDLNGVLAGVTPFTVKSDEDDVLEGFIGGLVSYAPTQSIELYVGGEAALANDEGYSYTGRVGGSIKF